MIKEIIGGVMLAIAMVLFLYIFGMAFQGYRPARIGDNTIIWVQER